MWTISNQQLANMKATRRAEFERQVCKSIIQRLDSPEVAEGMIREIVHRQTEHIIVFGFTEVEPILKFLQLSFSYPLLQEVPLSGDIINILSSPDKQRDKIDRLQDFLELTHEKQKQDV
ncbi:MAG: hypothetical protein LUF85_12815 [Bacteroides sp.]|nr:hypothetical protein [Bacteroides sp.]